MYINTRVLDKAHHLVNRGVFHSFHTLQGAEVFDQVLVAASDCQLTLQALGTEERQHCQSPSSHGIFLGDLGSKNTSAHGEAGAG